MILLSSLYKFFRREYLGFLSVILAIAAILLLPIGSEKIGSYNQAIAATKTISGSITISGVGAYTGGGVVTITNTKSGSTATGSVIGGRYSIGGLTAPGSQTYRVFLSPIPGYTILANNIQTTFSSGTSTVNFIISKNTPTPTKKPLPTPTKKPSATPTKKPNPTATPVANTKITLCIYKSGTTTPIQGAKITITGYSTVTVGSNGCYMYTFTRGKTITAKAEASGYAAQIKNISLTAATQQQNFSLSPTTASTPTPAASKSIVGLVYVIENGSTKGISNVRVSIKNLDNNDPATVVTTNSIGNYTLSGLVGTRYKVSVVIPAGYSLVSSNDIAITLNSEGKGSASFQLASSTSTSKTISGTVRALSSSGTEINYPGGGTITVTNQNSGTTKTSNVTSGSTGNGSYTVSGLTTPGSQTYKVSLAPPSGYTVSSGQNQTVGPFTSGTRTANFTIRQNAPTNIPSGTRYIEGSVYTQAGSSAIQGVGGVSVTIKNVDSTDPGTVVITNSDGRFIRTGLVGDNYRVSVAVPSGYSLISSNNQQVSLGSSGHTSVSFRLAPPGTSTNTSLNICVSKNGGSAISGAKIAIEGRSTETVGSNGCRSYTFLIGSTLKVTASATGYVPQTATIVLNTATTKNFYLNPSPTSTVAKVNLTVKVQAPTGISAPLSNLGVNVCYQTPIVVSGKTIDCELTGTGSGTDRVFKVYPNTTVEIQAFAVLEPGKNPSQVKKTVTIGSTNKTEVLTLPLSSSSTFNSKIKICVYNNGQNATPLSAKISITGYSTVDTGPDGCHDYTFTGGKSIAIKAEATGYAPQTKTIVLSSPTMPTQFFYLNSNPTNTPQDMGVIYGRVTDQKGYPVGNVNVVVSRGSLVITQAYTNGNGYYITRTLPYASNYSVKFGLGCFKTNTYSPLYLNANVVGLNRVLERIVSPSCQAPTGEIPEVEPPPDSYPDPDETYPAPPDPDSEVTPLDPDDPYPTEAPTPTAKPTTTNTPIPTRTPTPSATKTPIPTGSASTLTPSPSVTEPTIDPSPTTTPEPTNTPMVTPTPIPDGIFVTFNATLDGIGSGGDSQNPGNSSLSNKIPLHPSRQVLVEIFNAGEQKIKEASGTLTYNPETGTFAGSADFGTSLPSGTYLVKVKAPQFLKKSIPGIVTLNVGNTPNTLTDVTLITGDTNDDNALSILDYNMILECYSDLQPPESCTSDKKRASDLNDDGKVNQLDYNLFLRELSNQHGD